MHADAWTVCSRKERGLLAEHGNVESIGVRSATLVRAMRGRLIPAEAHRKIAEWCELVPEMQP